jgi:hypothetical protein
MTSSPSPSSSNALNLPGPSQYTGGSAFYDRQQQLVQERWKTIPKVESVRQFVPELNQSWTVGSQTLDHEGKIIDRSISTLHFSNQAQLECLEASAYNVGCVNPKTGKSSRWVYTLTRDFVERVYTTHWEVFRPDVSGTAEQIANGVPARLVTDAPRREILYEASNYKVWFVKDRRFKLVQVFSDELAYTLRWVPGQDIEVLDPFGLELEYAESLDAEVLHVYPGQTYGLRVRTQHRPLYIQDQDRRLIFTTDQVAPPGPILLDTPVLYVMPYNVAPAGGRTIDLEFYGRLHHCETKFLEEVCHAGIKCPDAWSLTKRINEPPGVPKDKIPAFKQDSSKSKQKLDLNFWGDVHLSEDLESRPEPVQIQTIDLGQRAGQGLSYRPLNSAALKALPPGETNAPDLVHVAPPTQPKHSTPLFYEFLIQFAGNPSDFNNEPYILHIRHPNLARPPLIQSLYSIPALPSKPITALALAPDYIPLSELNDPVLTKVAHPSMTKTTLALAAPPKLRAHLIKLKVILW